MSTFLLIINNQDEALHRLFDITFAILMSPLHLAIKHLGFLKLNSMQEQAVDAISQFTHIQLIAPTGSGKTAAFLLPILAKIELETKAPQVLIIAPTRELIQQISSVWKKMNTGILAVTCFGGHRIETEINELSAIPQIIFGTPGRINDHIERKSFSTDAIHTYVIDEFDKTLEPKFYDELAILQNSLTALQSQILVSATVMEALPDFIPQHDWKIVNESAGLLPTPKAFTVLSKEKDKLNKLIDLLHYTGAGTSIIFVNHREAAERISDTLTTENIENIFYHGGLSQLERMLALIKFKNQTVHILIASDIAARGIDIDGIENVIHYHLPENEAAYTHRNGRTARQGAKGNIYLIYHEEETLPDYITNNTSPKEIPYIDEPIPSPHWLTLTVNAGKKNKINKIDIVGFLSKQADLRKGDIGIVDVLDTISFIAVNKDIWKEILASVRGKKIKGKDYIFKVAK